LKTWNTESEWMGPSGTVYSSTQIRQIVRTMQAEVVALSPRDVAENTAADWAAVATYASQGISSGTPVTFQYFIGTDGRECGLDCVKTWGNSIGTMRVDTRVAAMITTNHVNPWPVPAGNPCPTTSPDARVGNGTWGPTDDFNGYATLAANGGAGTDYACSGVAIFPPARGQYHQSNLVHVRYQHLAYRGENLPGFDATGQDPFYTTQMNDLLWAEGELRRAGGTIATAVTRLNNSRVGRGALAPATIGEGVPSLLTKLAYEQEIEFMGQGPTPFFNRRRLGGLLSGTPFHMPVPAKELEILTMAVYSFGGTDPAKLMAPGSVGRKRVIDIHNEYMGMRRVASLFRR